mgnify:CR=1 FL=1
MHLGIIMDGNGRWAVQRRLPRAFGHKRGASRVNEIVRICPDLNIETLTLYAFSTENWQRAAHEVASLMKLFRGYLQNKFLELVENNVKVVFLGDTKPIDRDIVLQMKKLEKATRNNDGLTLNIALNYSGRDEIIRVTKKIARDCKSENLKIKDINNNLFQKYLDTKNQRDPDLIIRTAGNQRISNFLLWQIAYSELYFTETNWPDFSPEKLKNILEECKNRIRTYGTTDKKEKLSRSQNYNL